MQRAIAIARDAPVTEIPVGAVLAIGDVIIAAACNEVESSGKVWMHSEFVVIEKSLNELGAKFLEGASLYVTLEPCVMCFELIKKVKIRNVFFGAYHTSKRGFLDCDHRGLSFIGGIRERECKALISKRFEQLRAKSRMNTKLIIC